MFNNSSLVLGALQDVMRILNISLVELAIRISDGKKWKQIGWLLVEFQ